MVNGSLYASDGYDAWRNFILIVAALLVGKCITSFDEIKTAFSSITDFDKTYSQDYWPEILAWLLIVYIIKNAHGIIITLFDKAYINGLCNQDKNQNYNVIRIAFFYYLFTASVVWSLSLSLYLMETIQKGTTLTDRAQRLMLLIFLPSIILFIFDFLHKEFLFTVDANTKSVKISNIFSNPIKRNDHNDYKRIWVYEDIFSLIIVSLSLISINLFTDYPSIVILITICSTAFVLIINSILDYVLNCNYFFFQCADKRPINVQNTGKKNKYSMAIINGCMMFFFMIYAIIKNTYHNIKKGNTRKVND